MTRYKGVLVCGETSGIGLAVITRELLTSGRKLAAALRESLGIAIIGADLESIAEEAIALGAERVYAAEGPSFSRSVPEFYSRILPKSAASPCLRSSCSDKRTWGATWLQG
jgi:electron transfer flavoprotein alpha subunit